MIVNNNFKTDRSKELVKHAIINDFIENKTVGEYRKIERCIPNDYKGNVEEFIYDNVDDILSYLYHPTERDNILLFNEYISSIWKFCLDFAEDNNKTK